jgi:serine phosphatase RsbU (regulator of sigma subunit)
MSIPFFLGLVNFSVIHFALYYINPWEYIKKIDRVYVVILRVMECVSIVHIIVSLAMDNFFFSVVSCATITSINTIMGGLTLGIFMWRYRTNSREARFFLAGFIWFIVGALVYALKEYSLIPASFMTEHGVQIGAAINVVALSFALGDRINVSKKKLEEAIRGLENRVLERTTDLQAAMEELEAINEQLNKARDDLWGEMEIAKRIQTILLPTEFNVEGYEITASMNTSSKVGGDYYDIINAGDAFWLVIGDVSGHGVPAGLIMMMAQTLINFIIAENPAIAPSDLLSRINQMLRKNIRLIDEDKYMTITVLSCHKEGNFQYSGLHQDILIYRARNDEVEIIETRGMWLGINLNLPGDFSFCNDSFTLDVGDVLMLYTDGIIEAWRKGTLEDHRDPASDMFGIARLVDVFHRVGRSSPDEIQEAILDGLDDYICNDDVTLVVVKRMS